MKVKELIEKLQKFDLENELEIQFITDTWKPISIPGIDWTIEVYEDEDEEKRTIIDLDF